MSSSQEYPVVLGERHSELPKKTKARYILLPECKMYRKEIQLVFCQKCDVKHKVYDWVQVVPKCNIGFIDVQKDKVHIISPPDDYQEPKTNFSKLKVTNVGTVDRITGLLTYIINVSNISSNPAKNISIIASLPNVGSKWTIIQPQNKCQINKNELCCDFGVIPPERALIIKVSASVRSFCNSKEQNREVFSSVQVTAENADSVDNESITIIPCL